MFTKIFENLFKVDNMKLARFAFEVLVINYVSWANLACNIDQTRN